MGEQPLLEVAGLEVEFGGGRHEPVHAVAGVDLHVRRGEILAVVGESGSGKSATALAISGLLPRPHGRVTAGSVRLDGTELVGASAATWRTVRGARLGMVFQDPLTALNPVQRVGVQVVEAIRAHRTMSRRQAHERAVELLGRTGLPAPADVARSHPHQLSGGMRQRAMIAIATASDPEVLIADEPTTALDVTVQAQILDLLVETCHRLDSAVILITHDLGVVARVADRVAVMAEGRIVETGEVHEIFDHPAHAHTQALLEATPRLVEVRPDS